MKYIAKCTWCAPLLMNCKKYAKAYYAHDDHDTYILVNTKEEFNLIETLNCYQEGTFKTYKEILKYE